jgi:hypothetical protein
MKRPNRATAGRKGIAALAMGLFITSGGAAQTASEGRIAPEQSPSLAEALRELGTEVRELSAELRQTRQEAARAQAETEQLRRELSETRQQLATLSARLPGSVPPPAAPAVEAGPPPGREPAGSGEASLDARVSRLEEDEQLLNSKLSDQYQSKVESGSKYRVRLSGTALLNVFENRGATDNQDLPALALSPRPLDTGHNFGATVRQSLVGLEVFGPEIAGARTSGNVQFDFFGGFPPNESGVTEGLVRMRTATLRLDWPSTAVVAGQDAPFFSPLSPTSLASLAIPALAYSGNLWSWTPQIRVEHRWLRSDGSSWLVQGGILDPLTGEPSSSSFDRTPGAGERSGQPAYAARLAWGSTTAGGRPVAIGAGGYYGRQDWGYGRAVDSWAGTVDWSVPLGRYLAWSGELYQGRALGGLGAAAGRSVLWNGPLADPSTAVIGLNVAGGWSQVKASPTEKLEFNGAFGEDVPRRYDLEEFTQGFSYLNSDVGRNQTAMINAIYRARSNVLLSLEYRRLWTFPVNAPRNTADHVNVGVGILF